VRIPWGDVGEMGAGGSDYYSCGFNLEQVIEQSHRLANYPVGWISRRTSRSSVRCGCKLLFARPARE